MAARVKHQFHGTLEQANTAQQAEMPVQVIEAIEIIVFALVIFTVFFKFKNMLSVNTWRQTPVNEKAEAPEGISANSAKA